MKTRLLSLLLLFLVALSCAAQEDPAHNELRAMRDGLLAKMNAGDVEGELQFLHPNVVVTWHNAEVSRGREGVRKYLERMLHGPAKVVEKFGADVKVDELSIIYGGDTAIAFGSADERFTLAGGKQIDFTGRWSATMVKEGGRWLIASLHSSDNLFDNPLLNAAKYGLWVAACGALAVGGAVGWLLGRRGKKA
jgi:uncharacterized protein (TIGR02246 family)